MKTLLLTGLLAWAAAAAHGQEYYFDLRKEPLEVPGRTVAIESVIDGRQNPQIGVMYRGGLARPATIFFHEGAAPELTAFLQARLPARPTDHPVVLCLRQLQLAEPLAYETEPTPAQAGRSDLDLAFDVYTHLPDGYHFVQRVAGHWGGSSYQSSLYLSAWLTRLLGYCVGQLTQADWPAAARQPALTLNQLPADVPTPSPLAQSQAPILREAPRRGLYHSFAQFVANRPDTTQAFRLDTLVEDWSGRFSNREAARWWWGWWHVARVRPLLATAHPSVPAGIWGFCDGKQLFIERAQKFYPLARYEDFFTLVGEAPTNVRYQALLDQQPARRFSQNPLLATPLPGGEPLPLALDLRTGEVGSFPGLRPRHSDTAYVYLYRPAQARNLLTVHVLLNGREAAQLYPGAYCRLAFVNSAVPLRLSLEGAGPPDGPVQLLIPNPAQPVYLEITPVAGSNHYWRWVSEAQGQTALREIAMLRPDAH